MPDLLVPIIAILGKYVIGKGANMVGDVGQEAVDTAKQLWDAVVGKLKKDPSGTFVVDDFENKPDVYKYSLKDKLEKLVAADEALRLELTALLNRYQKADERHSSIAHAHVRNQHGAVAIGTEATGQSAGNNGVVISGNNNEVVGPSLTINHGADPKAINKLEYDGELRAINAQWENWQRIYTEKGGAIGDIKSTGDLFPLGMTSLIFMMVAFAIGTARVLPEEVSFGPLAASVICSMILFFRAWARLSSYEEEKKRHFERLRKLKEKFKGKLPVENTSEH
jgi:hypothetical protein